MTETVDGLRHRAVWLGAGLIVANLLVWAWALAAFHGSPLLLATAVLAYGLGLRHAVDADHIAAIDNVTRRLMHEGRRPVAVGSFFALGHSTVVVVAATAIAASATTLQQRYPGLVEGGSVLGSAVSALFLFAIAGANAAVLVGLYRLLRRVQCGGSQQAEELEVFLSRGGVLGRVLRRLFRLISHSWQMYPLGLLFGLGFDTASEIGLLGIAASEAAKGLPIWSILVFPALFTAGMSLVDTADGMLMLGVYGWALRSPVRQLRYNLVITGLSVAVALLVGGIEILGLLSGKLGLSGEAAEVLNALIDNSGLLGGFVVALFVATWALSALFYRLTGYGKVRA